MAVAETHRLKRHCLCAAALVISGLVAAQPAVLEEPGVFGECLPVLAAVADELRLYREPDLESPQVVVPFQAGWRIEAPKHEGLTRVVRAGSLRTTEPDENMICPVEAQSGPSIPEEGELVEYLYYLGEGFGEIRFRGARCHAEVVEDLGHFEVVSLPETQAWLRVFHADGTSPGWLLHDGTQTRVVRVEC